MHFVAMLAFKMPGMRTGYDPGLTLLSLALAILFTSAGFSIMNGQVRFAGRTIAAGLLMGSGVLAMHYLGMAAMRMQARVTYDQTWVAISVLIAMIAATAAVWLASREQRLGERILAAGVMGAAISGMHYAGMHAAIFTHPPPSAMPVTPGIIDQTYLAAAVGAITTLILVLALASARLERVFHGSARREAQIALRLRVADILRYGGSAEALNQIAALMGEHFAVSRTGFADLNPEEDVFSYDVCWTNGEVPPLLGRLPAAAFGVKIVAALKAGETVVVEDLQTAELSDELRTRDTARNVDTRSNSRCARRARRRVANHRLPE